MGRHLIPWLLGKEINLTGDGGFVRRSIWSAIALSLSVLVTSALLARWDWFLGLLLGSTLSLFQFRLLIHSASQWLLGNERSEASQIWKGFLLRLLFTGVAMAVAILYLPMSLLALAIGLFMAQAGLLLSFALQRLKLEEG